MKAEFVPIGRKAQQSAASRWQRPIPPPHERPQSQPVMYKNQSGRISAGSSGLSPAMPLPPQSAPGSRASDPDSPAKSALQSERFSRRDGIPEATSGKAAPLFLNPSLPPLAGVRSAEVRSATGPAESPRRLARPALPPLPPQPNNPR